MRPASGEQIRLHGSRPGQRLHRLRRQARNDADTLLDKAIDYVENNPAMFPEYDPKENIRRRVLIKGGFIL